VKENIIVLDDFLPHIMYDILTQFVSREPLAYGSRSNFKTDPHGHWSRDFVAAGPHNLADVSSMLAGNETFAPLHAAWEFLRDTRLTSSVLIRCYLNGYTYGTDGYFHTDAQRPDEYTTILYMNDYWEPDWAGETVFLGEGCDIISAVLPRHNRVVIFPSNVQHAGRAVSRKCMVLRKTLVFKARKRRSNDFEKLSTFLRNVGAAKRAHKYSTLHDHLVRTFSLLEAKGYEGSVCFGGGLHALYGTNAFGPGVLTRDARALIVNEFGERAEELAYLFSILERPRTLELPLVLNTEKVVVELTNGRTLDLCQTTFNDLRKIECANLADQGTLARYRNLSRIWETG
jgi:SM-20-related protein